MKPKDNSKSQHFHGTNQMLLSNRKITKLNIYKGEKKKINMQLRSTLSKLQLGMCLFHYVKQN